MHFFGMLFWIAVLWCVFSLARRRRWERWAMMGPRGYAPAWYSRGWYDSSEFYAPKDRGAKPKRRDPPGEQQDYIDALESRVSELENRLDFTERLLAERKDQSSQ